MALTFATWWLVASELERALDASICSRRAPRAASSDALTWEQWRSSTLDARLRMYSQLRDACDRGGDRFRGVEVAAYEAAKCCDVARLESLMRGIEALLCAVSHVAPAPAVAKGCAASSRHRTDGRVLEC